MFEVLAAGVTDIYVASAAPTIAFMTAVVIQFLQNRNLKRENERLSNGDEKSYLLRFAEGLQKQADTNYKAYQDAKVAEAKADASRQAMYENLLQTQDAYAAFRKQHLNLGESDQ